MAQVRIFRHYVHMPHILLAVTEALIFVASVYLATYLRFSDDPSIAAENISQVLVAAITFTAVMLVSMYSMGVYRSYLDEGLPGMMLRTAASFALGATALALLYYILNSQLVFLGRGVFALATVFSFFGLGLYRMAYYRVSNEDSFKRRVLVYGAGKRASNITHRLRTRFDRRGFKIIGYVPVEAETNEVNEADLVDLNGRTLLNYVDAEKIDEIVIAPDDRRNRLPLKELLDCRLSNVDVIDLLTFFERESGRIELDLLRPSWMIFSDGFNRSVFRLFSERLFDIFASGVLLCLTWPIMLLTVIAIKLEEGMNAPILYRQIRVGLDGKSFPVLKFRSMRTDAEANGAVWAMKNDTRVTRVGGFIRKVRIDELPQIFNVFMGDMAFVGPRPERPEFVKGLSEKIEYYSERHRVKPGITGWAQLCYPYGASDEDAMRKLEYDLYYLKNHSLLLDIIILIQTVEVILFKKGAR